MIGWVYIRAFLLMPCAALTGRDVMAEIFGPRMED